MREPALQVCDFDLCDKCCPPPVAPPQAQDEHELVEPSLVPQQQPAVHVSFCSRIRPRYFPGPDLDHMLARVDGLPSLPALVSDEVKAAVPQVLLTPLVTCADWEALAAMLSPLKSNVTPFPTHAVAAIPSLAPVTLETPAPPTQSPAVAAIRTLPPDVLARISSNKKANEVAAAAVPAGPPLAVHQVSLTPLVTNEVAAAAVSAAPPLAVCQVSLTSMVTNEVAAAAVSAFPARVYDLVLPPGNLRRQDGLVHPLLPPPSTAVPSFLAEEFVRHCQSGPLSTPPSLSSTASTMPPVSDKLLAVVSCLPPLPAKRNSRLKLPRPDAVVKPVDTIPTSVKPQSDVIVPPPLPDEDLFYKTFFHGMILESWDTFFWC